MPAQKQNLFVPAGGLESEIDDKLLPLGSALEVENYHPARGGTNGVELVRRYGGRALPSFAGTPMALGVHRAALVRFNGPGAGTPPIGVTASPSGPWNDSITSLRRGPVYHSLAKVGGGLLSAQVAVGAGYYWVVAQDAGTLLNPPMLRLYALDTATFHVQWTTAVSTGANGFRAWKVTVCNGAAFFVWVEAAGATRVLKVDPSASFAITGPTGLGAATVAAGYAPWIMDVQAKDATSFRVAWQDDTGTALAADVTSGLAVTTWIPVSASATTIPITGGLAWVQDYGASGKFALLTANNTDGLRCQWNFGAIASGTRMAANTYTLDASATSLGEFIVGHTFGSDASGQICAVYGLSISTGVSFATRQAAGTIATATFIKGVRLASQTWTAGGEFYVTVRYDNTIDGTHFVVNVPTNASSQPQLAPLDIIEPRKSTAVAQAIILPPGPSSVAINGSANVVALTYQPRFESGVTDKDVFGVELASLTHAGQTNTTLGPPREIADSLLAPHGFLGQYDGAGYGEAGFAHPPEILSATPSAGGGLTASSNYYYAATFMRMDAQGRVWRSAPSEPFLMATGVGQGTGTAVSRSLKIDGWANAYVELWRGVAGDQANLRKVAQKPNVITSDTVSFTDVTSDATLSANEDLYTNGGVLANDAAPAFGAIAVAGGRAWGISQDDPQALWYSKEIALGQGVGWSEEFVLDVRDQHGPLRGLAVIDDKLIAFKDDAIYAVTGDGPDVLGRGGSFEARPLSIGVGCNNSQSICEYRDGAMFLSTSTRAGYFMVDRGLSVQYVGAGVQRYSQLIPSGATYATSLMQVRIYTTSGRTLVYDLVTGKWVTYVGQTSCIGAATWNGQPTYGASLTILTEDPTLWTDGGTGYQGKIAFPIVQVNGIYGYERFYRVKPVGEARDAATLQATLYNELGTQLAVASTAVAAPGVLDLELRYTSKLGGVKLVLQDNSPATAGFAISGYAMVIAAKSGLKRAPTRMA